MNPSFAEHRTLYNGIFAWRCPAYLSKAIRVRGGVNLYGEPRYRVVWSDARRIVAGMKRTIWDKELHTDERNPAWRRPLREEVGMFPVPMYDAKHKWVLERWAPPPCSPEQWYMVEEAGGTLVLCGDKWLPGAGVYPTYGDYEEAAYNFPNYALSEAVVMEAIGRVETGLARLPESKEQRMLMARSAAEAEQRRIDSDYDEFAWNVLNSDSGAGFDARTPGGQAELHREAESIGIRSQIF